MARHLETVLEMVSSGLAEVLTWLPDNCLSVTSQQGEQVRRMGSGPF